MFCDAGFRLGGRGPLLSGKGHKAIDAPSGFIGLGGRRPWMRADQLAVLRQGPPVDESVRPWGRTAGVGYRKIIDRMIKLGSLQ